MTSVTDDTQSTCDTSWTGLDAPLYAVPGWVAITVTFPDDELEGIVRLVAVLNPTCTPFNVSVICVPCGSVYPVVFTAVTVTIACAGVPVW